MKQAGKSKGHMSPRKQSRRLPSILLKQSISNQQGTTKGAKPH